MERAPSPSSPVGPSGHTGFDLALAELYLGRRSSMELRLVLRVLGIKANGDALRRAYQPLPRTELDKERVSLWTSVVGPMFNRASYRPTPPALIDGIMETDLRVIDPNRHSGARLRSKLEGHFRTLRLLYTVAVANYARSG
ncbi:hypothetical protein I4F81_000015 [Pyropia yezoensis]|uniref:Uncharacterized protein n=1 Tax=Pyropia yezoensis TaxID=2788 RepID=A0ACC3BI24_PYRYE|nr:hypothetical protein I4F81_000015 [Neopyropia yezoensis]